MYKMLFIFINCLFLSLVTNACFSQPQNDGYKALGISGLVVHEGEIFLVSDFRNKPLIRLPKASLGQLTKHGFIELKTSDNPEKFAGENGQHEDIAVWNNQLFSVAGVNGKEYPKGVVAGKNTVLSEFVFDSRVVSRENNGIEGLDFNQSTSMGVLLFEGCRGTTNPYLYFYQVGDKSQEIRGVEISPSHFPSAGPIRATSVRFLPSDSKDEVTKIVVLVQKWSKENDVVTSKKKWLATYTVKFGENDSANSIELDGNPIPLQEVFSKEFQDDVVRNWEGITFSNDGRYIFLVNDNSYDENFQYP